MRVDDENRNAQHKTKYWQRQAKRTRVCLVINENKCTPLLPSENVANGMLVDARNAYHTTTHTGIDTGGWMGGVVGVIQLFKINTNR